MFTFQTLSNTYKSQSLSLSLSPIFPPLFVETILSLESTPLNEISVASSFSRHLFCSYQASFSSWQNLFVFNVKRNLAQSSQKFNIWCFIATSGAATQGIHWTTSNTAGSLSDVSLVLFILLLLQGRQYWPAPVRSGTLNKYFMLQNLYNVIIMSNVM